MMTDMKKLLDVLTEIATEYKDANSPFHHMVDSLDDIRRDLNLLRRRLDIIERRMETTQPEQDIENF